MDTGILIGILLFAPLIGFLINAFGVNKLNHNYKLAGMIGSCASIISFVAATFLFLKLASLPAEERILHYTLAKWIDVGTFKANFGYLIDPITAIMIMIITGVGSLIHIYSAGYMSHDAHPAKFFCYLNLFLFSMLTLVTGDNLALMFVGWEGVGLCSYLLIGFWYTDTEKAIAGMKAFVVNRVGDAGFLLGLFTIFVTFGTVEFTELSKLKFAVEVGFWGPISIATLFMFVGAAGKSAQIPLYVWLPDAMAGPTPVSALIHAATMVTAGVYMIVRLSFLYVAAPQTMMVVACVGAGTALFAATIGLFQYDIKKVLAYSTVSQLGYMFLAVGVGAFTAGLFHVMTHAFFKALMFLGSGSVIHGMGGEQDIRKMGGLSSKMPITHKTFVLGWLAIIGTPLFSGFFSKDEILWSAYASPHGSKFLWVIGVITAGTTAFYMTRLMALTFWGESRVDKKVHVHESPAVMTVPLMILAVLSVVGGFLGVPHILGHVFHMPNILEGWLHHSVAHVEMGGSALEEVATMVASLAMAGLGAYGAYFLYVNKTDLVKELFEKGKSIHKIIHNKYFVDEGYDWLFVRPLINGSKALWVKFDVKVVDRATYLVSDITMASASMLRMTVNGNLQQYILYIVIGLVAALGFLFKR